MSLKCSDKSADWPTPSNQFFMVLCSYALADKNECTPPPPFRREREFMLFFPLFFTPAQSLASSGIPFFMFDMKKKINYEDYSESIIRVIIKKNRGVYT